MHGNTKLEVVAGISVGSDFFSESGVVGSVHKLYAAVLPHATEVICAVNGGSVCFKLGINYPSKVHSVVVPADVEISVDGLISIILSKEFVAVVIDLVERKGGIFTEIHNTVNLGCNAVVREIVFCVSAFCGNSSGNESENHYKHKCDAQKSCNNGLFHNFLLFLSKLYVLLNILYTEAYKKSSVFFNF